jgi:hypothetical protein
LVLRAVARARRNRLQVATLRLPSATASMLLRRHRKTLRLREPALGELAADDPEARIVGIAGLT